MSLSPEIAESLALIHRRLDRLELLAGLGSRDVPSPLVRPEVPLSQVPLPAMADQSAVLAPPLRPFPMEAPRPAPTSAHRTETPSSQIAEAYERGDYLSRLVASKRADTLAGYSLGVGSQRAATRSVAAFSLERFIGAKFFAVAGGLIVTLGVGFFLKLAYDWGWFTVPPGVKCLAAAAFGLMLLGLGEVARRKINAWASAGLSSAGVATLMASVYAAHTLYALLGPSAAFALLVLSAVLGGVVAWLSSLPVVAAVSMIGAYLVPVLVRSVHPSAYVLPVYLCVLLALGLWAAWKLTPRDSNFAAVRAVAWVGTAVLGTIWCMTLGHENPVLAVVFLLTVPAMVHAELVLTGRRIDSLLHGSAEVREVTKAAPRILESSGVPRLLLGSLACNAWSVTLCTVIVRGAWPMLDWLPAAGGLAACGALAVALAGHLTTFREPPRTALGALGAALAGQAAGMLVVIVSLALSGWTQSLAWLGMGIGGCLAGRWVRVRALEVYGVLLKSIGTARIVLASLWAFTNTGPTPIMGGAYSGGAVVSTQFAMLAFAGVLWLVSGRVLVSGGSERSVTAAGASLAPSVLGMLGGMVGSVLLLASVPMYLNTLDSAWLAPAWCALALLIAIGHRFEPRMGLALVAMLTMPAAALAWAGCWGQSYFSFAAPVLMHPGVWSALAISVIAVVVARMTRDWVPKEGRAAVMPVAWSFAGVVAFISTNLEVSRAATLVTNDPSVRGAAISVYWALAGLALVVFGFARRLAPVRHVGLCLMGLATAKVLVFDLSGVGQVWRVVSTVGVGLLLIAVAMVYSKIAVRIDAGHPDAARGTGDLVEGDEGS